MLHCVAPYSLRGAIWYQGESNADRAQQYQTLLPAMISSWRHAWNDQGLYFGIVQLANFMKHDSLPVASEWAELREAQLMTAQSDSHAGLAVTIDIGDAHDIHPKNKLGVGRRLSQWALARVYSRNSQPHSGPLFRSVEFLGNSARVVFGHAGRGLVCAGSDTLHGFCIAGSDSIFHWASAAITDDSTITVRSDRVRQPIALRYAWGNNPRGNLYNSDSLPASPFRTDKWPGLGWTKR
jgi:sialate O-acetylesterase